MAIHHRHLEVLQDMYEVIDDYEYKFMLLRSTVEGSSDVMLGNEYTLARKACTALKKRIEGIIRRYGK